MSVGLDIGTRTTKVVELGGDRKSYSLKAAGVVGYSDIEVEKLQDKKDMAGIADIIRKLLKDAKISAKNVAICLPETQVFTRIITLPLLTDQEIASAIKWESEQYIPIPAADAVVQYEILERRETGTPPGVAILLVAAPKVLVEKYIKIANLAGLNASLVEPTLLSLTRVFAPTDRTVILVDSGARSTNVAIAKQGKLYFSRSIPTAGTTFTRAVARSLNINSQQAEEYKRAYGLSAEHLEGKVASAIDPVFRLLVDEIRKTVHYYQSEQKEDIPSSIIVSGGLSGMPQVDARLAQLLNMEVVIGNPFANIKTDIKLQKSVAPYAPLYSAAVGLAMGGE